MLPACSPETGLYLATYLGCKQTERAGGCGGGGGGVIDEDIIKPDCILLRYTPPSVCVIVIVCVCVWGGG